MHATIRDSTLDYGCLAQNKFFGRRNHKKFAVENLVPNSTSISGLGGFYLRYFKIICKICN